MKKVRTKLLHLLKSTTCLGAARLYNFDYSSIISFKTDGAGGGGGFGINNTIIYSGLGA